MALALISQACFQYRSGVCVMLGRLTIHGFGCGFGGLASLHYNISTDYVGSCRLRP